jgi:hypothetical protein
MGFCLFTFLLGGSGYVYNENLTFPFPNTVYDPLVLNVVKVGSGGAITQFSILDSGAYLQTNLPSNPQSQVYFFFPISSHLSE